MTAAVEQVAVRHPDEGIQAQYVAIEALGVLCEPETLDKLGGAARIVLVRHGGLTPARAILPSSAEPTAGRRVTS